MYTYLATVLRVVDGDTFDLEVDLGFNIKFKQRFRLDGIDTPETWRPKTSAEGEHGEQATLRTGELILGQEIKIVSSISAGMYGRYTCRVTLPDGRDLSEVLIVEGYSKKESYE